MYLGITWHANPTEPVFWFMMQIGMTIGFFTSYPANIWLVKKGSNMVCDN